MRRIRPLVSAGVARHASNVAKSCSGINPSQLTVERTRNPKTKLSKKDLIFGKIYSDHMLEVDWDVNHGWGAPRIGPYHNLSISPAASALHYALQCFEGMKAYKDVKGKLRLFRPDLNMERLNNSLARLYMPTFDGDAFIECIKELVKVDKDWVPEGEGYSIYLRPTAISTYPFLGVGATQEVKLYVIMSPVGPYFPEGFNPIKLYADTENIRAWPGGVGNTKLGGNYGPTIRPQMLAAKHGCSQVLWLGEKHSVTEVGAMNVLFFWINEDGDKELLTAPLSRGDILPGVTRRSILELAREWGEFKVTERFITMPDIVKAHEEGRLIEAFGAGTAAVVCPIKAIVYKDKEITFIKDGEKVGKLTKRFWDAMADIQYGRVDHPWSWRVE